MHWNIIIKSHQGIKDAPDLHDILVLSNMFIAYRLAPRLASCVSRKPQ